MGNGKWEMGNWEMGNGKWEMWEMGNGKWEMGNGKCGKWDMGNGKWEIESTPSPRKRQYNAFSTFSKNVSV